MALIQPLHKSYIEVCRKRLPVQVSEHLESKPNMTLKFWKTWFNNVEIAQILKFLIFKKSVRENISYKKEINHSILLQISSGLKMFPSIPFHRPNCTSGGTFLWI